MRYFWHAMIAMIVFAAIVFVFFAFSLSTKNRITFTDGDLPTAPTVTIADPSIGASDARVTIVNFGDYQCGACKDVDEALTNVVETFPNDVRLVWKDMPNDSVHPEATPAAIAARCAAKQNKFFEFHAYLFSNQSALGAELYTGIAEQLGLKASSFARCVENKDTLPLVQKSYEEGLALGIATTPTLYMNGTRYTGSLTTSGLTAAVRALLSTTP